MWKFEINSGRFWQKQPGIVDGLLYFPGYSGHREGKNNPAMQSIHDVGPIPVGQYLIGTFFDDPTKGPIVAHLTPLPGTNTYGRTGFMIHGDSILHPGTASLGCIIQSRLARETCRDSADYGLEVVSGLEEIQQLA